MIITKQDYFARSRDQELPNRCPILSRCGRRFRTIRLANEGVSFAEDFGPEEPEVPISGEGPYTIGGGTSFLIGGTCPEVALFEPTSFIIGLNHAPTTKGQYDKYTNPQYEVLETGHFSECSEYSLAITDTNLRIQSPNQQEITRQILEKMDELLMAVREAKVDEMSKKSAAAAVEDARKTPSLGMIKRAAEAIGPLASIIDAGSKLAPHIEALGRLIGKI